MNYCVYRITNLKNGRIYIGSTKDAQTRKAEHFGQLRSGKHCNGFLQSDFKIYGESAFIFEVIHDEFKTRQAMLLKEYQLILTYKGQKYNIDTNCPVIDLGTGRGKWKKYKSKVIRHKTEKIKKAESHKKKERKKRMKNKFDHPNLDILIENKRRREMIRG